MARGQLLSDFAKNALAVVAPQMWGRGTEETTIEPLVSELGQNLPRQSLAVAAATPLITDTKADGRRGRNGPILLQKSARRPDYADAAHSERSGGL